MNTDIKKSRTQKAAAIAVIIGIAWLPAQATLLIYEGFNYTIPSNLQYSGTGEIVNNSEDGAISLTNVTSVERSANWMTGNMISVGAQSLSYTDANSNTLVTSGGQGTLFNARGARYYTNSIAATGGTVYGSYLWQTPTLNVDNEWRGHFEVRNAAAGLDVRIGLGLDGNHDDTNLQVRYGGTNHTTSVALAAATTYYVLYKAEYNGTGQMTNFDLWLNPDSLTSEAVSGAADLTYSGAIGFGGFGGFSINKDNLAGGFNPIYDEIRVGTTWDSISPIPEPGTLALVALGVLALFRRRRN